MEMLEKNPNNRLTLRLPNDLIEALKTEANKKDLSLNTLIGSMLSKNIVYAETVNLIPNVIIPCNLLTIIVREISDQDVINISKEGPLIVQKLFDIMGTAYNIDNIIQNYFILMSKHCNWFEFSYVQKGSKYRLVFSTGKNTQWTKLIQNYIHVILLSLKIIISYESVHDGIIVFEFFQK